MTATDTARDEFTATVIDVADVLIAHGVDTPTAVHEATEFVYGLVMKARAAVVPEPRLGVDDVLADLSA